MKIKLFNSRKDAKTQGLFPLCAFEPLREFIKLSIITSLFFKLLLLNGCSTEIQPSEKTEKSETVENQDWLLFRGDASLSGYTSTQLPDSPKLLWTYKSDSRTASSPIICGGIIYWSDKRGRVYGIDYQGKHCFDYDFKTAVEATPMIYDSVLYIGRIDGFLTALSLTKKDTLWNFETMGQISASPNIADFEDKKVIVVGSYDNYLYCLDSRNGKLVKRFLSGYYINGAVALWNEYVIFGGCDSWLRIINTNTGIQTDSLLLDTYIPASPAISENDCYVADCKGNIYHLLINEGKFAKAKKIFETKGDDGSFVSVPALSESTLYILSDDKHLYALDRKDGSMKWKFLQKGDSGESSPVVCFDKVITCTKTGIISILNSTDGKLLWEYDTGERITASPAVINGRFYILTNKGTIFCFGDVH